VRINAPQTSWSKWCALVATLLFASASAAQPTPRPVSTAAIRDLSGNPESQALEIVTSGIVASFLPGHNAIFLLQETAGVLVSLNELAPPRSENGSKSAGELQLAMLPTCARIRSSFEVTRS